MTFGAPTAVLRIFDEDKAGAFYVGYLGFKVDWEHRFEPDLPLYMQVSRGACRLHLTGHHGDCCPGAAVRIGCPDVNVLLAELRSKNYKALRPSAEQVPWGGSEIALTDPFGNRITFYSERADT